MWTPSSTPTRRGSRPSRGVLLAAVLATLTSACSDPKPAAAQQVVFDPKNHVENALQAARQLESLANEARMLANQARQLAASPYSHLGETGQTLQAIGELARTVKGVATDVGQLQSQFADLYPTSVEGLDPRKALQQHNARVANARETAQDLARTAAELERLAQGRDRRITGALNASQSAQGQTAAIQSSNQLLVVLAEDLSSLRTILLAQSRLMAEDTARRAAERAAGAEARRQFWGRDDSKPIPPPNFDPYVPASR
ncbi:MAG: P-type conjugative transfer protein TrbJ [Caulobacter sp.]|nr:P-type conjugative transfer protein TrbJ [Caulobacter sp.]